MLTTARMGMRHAHARNIQAGMHQAVQTGTGQRASPWPPREVNCSIGVLDLVGDLAATLQGERRSNGKYYSWAFGDIRGKLLTGLHQLVDCSSSGTFSLFVRADIMIVECAASIRWVSASLPRASNSLRLYTRCSVSESTFGCRPST